MTQISRFSKTFPWVRSFRTHATNLMKECFKCNRTLPLNEFYPHPRMKDGYLNKCKECNKVDVRKNYRTRKTQYAAYDRQRFQNPKRKAAVVEMARQRRRREPQKSRARQAVSNAVRDGRIKRLPCEVCGDPKSQGHHDDYSQPLNVRWLCFKHHREHHGQEVAVA